MKKKTETEKVVVRELRNYIVVEDSDGKRYRYKPIAQEIKTSIPKRNTTKKSAPKRNATKKTKTEIMAAKLPKCKVIAHNMTTEQIIEKQVQVERELKERRIEQCIRKMPGKE